MKRRSLSRRYGHARLAAEDFRLLVDNVIMAASDNAWNTEGVTDAYDNGPQWHAAFVATLQSIRDSLQSPRECSSYGISKPLTSAQAEKVYREARRLRG